MKTLVQFAWLILLLSAAQAFADSPHIFYSDLESGPNNGGQADAGAFVTIYGINFGKDRGSSTVTLGGKAVASYAVWTDSKIAFQPGRGAQTGDIVVHVGGQASNGIPFTVRAGKIYYVAKSGSDHGSGAFNSPWRTVVKAVKS